MEFSTVGQNLPDLLASIFHFQSLKDIVRLFPLELDIEESHTKLSDSRLVNNRSDQHQ